jgi:centrosomal protein CEP104
VYNEGDKDLEPYLNPLIKQAGGNIRSLEIEVLNRAMSDGTLMVTGVNLWNALHSENWRHRQAACEAFRNFLKTNPLPQRY